MSNLQFQPFDDGFNLQAPEAATFSGSIGDRNNYQDNSDTTTEGPKRSLFSLSFFQQYFDVDSDQVMKRLLNSMIPTTNNFILDFVQPVPDLWGPLWVSITLVFSIGIFGNIAQYIENDGAAGEYGSDFRLVTSAASLIFLYVVFVPLIIFAVLWNRKSDLLYPYVDLLCAFGYSLTIFIPVSLLWVTNINWFRWALVFVAVALSGGVLAKSIYPAFKNDANRLVAFGSVALILFLHFLLALTFKEYFFDAVHPIVNAPTAALLPDPTGNVSVAASQVQGPSVNGVTLPPLPNDHQDADNKNTTKSADPVAPVTTTVVPEKKEVENEKPSDTDKSKKEVTEVAQKDDSKPADKESPTEEVTKNNETSKNETSKKEEPKEEPKQPEVAKKGTKEGEVKEDEKKPSEDTKEEKKEQLKDNKSS